jgi:hypothetical protein
MEWQVSAYLFMIYQCLNYLDSMMNEAGVKLYQIQDGTPIWSSILTLLGYGHHKPA